MSGEYDLPWPKTRALAKRHPLYQEAEKKEAARGKAAVARWKEPRWHTPPYSALFGRRLAEKIDHIEARFRRRVDVRKAMTAAHVKAHAIAFDVACASGLENDVKVGLPYKIAQRDSGTAGEGTDDQENSTT